MGWGEMKQLRSKWLALAAVICFVANLGWAQTTNTPARNTHDMTDAEILEAKRVVGWFIWYDSGETDLEKWEPLEFDSRTAKFEDLPDDGFEMRKLCFADGTARSDAGADYYFEARHPTGLTIYGSNNDPPEMTRKRYEVVSIKRGRWLPDALMSIVTKRMAEAKCDVFSD